MRILPIALLACVPLLFGCSALTPVEPTVTPAVSISGSVHGGNQLLSGAKIYLYAAGSAGYGTAARSVMINTAGYVTSDANGNFSITGDYACLLGDQVYVLALGGNPGLATGTNNPAIALAAALGPCSKLLPTSFAVVNEVSTVAAAYALAGFMGSTTQLSTSGTTLAQTGLANAFLSASNLADLGSGVASTTTPARNGAAPNSEINTLANILASCVNSSGTTTACSNLFAAATTPSGAVPTDTLQAALNIAHNPGTSVAKLFALSTASAPFQPTLTSAPNDWTVAISYQGGGLFQTGNYATGYSIAVDASGNIWSGNLYSVTELSPTGAPLSPAAGYTAGFTTADSGINLALDTAGNAWAGVYNYGSTPTSARVVKLSATGSLVGTYTGGGIAAGGTDNLAFDPSGNLAVVGTLRPNGQITLSKLSPAGTALSPATGWLGSMTGLPSATLVADTAGNFWAGADEFSNTGTHLLANFACAGFLDEQIALDHTGNFWGPGIECNAAGTQIATPPSGLNGAVAEAVDGDGRIWSLDDGGPIAVTTASGTLLSPTGGYQEPAAVFNHYGANFLALDGSGNLWVAVDGPFLTEFVGVAAPVVTPLAAGVAQNKLGTRP